MDDDELQMLQRELMSVQQQKANPLSQRTVAEIMLKLQKNNFPFFPTTDGNQYITPQCLDKEIINLTKQRGKIPIILLPQILNINTDTVQSRISLITTNSNIIRHNQLLLTPQEINSIVSNLKQKLEAQGKIDLEQIAITNQFNIAFVRKIIEQNLIQLNAQLANNQLITKEYTQLIKSRIKGYLNAISKPISIEILIKNCCLENRNIESLIQQLIKNGQLKGKCFSSYFIPEKFSQNQKKFVNIFFQNNGYVEFSFLTKNFITTKHEEWLAKNLESPFIIFEKVCFSHSKLENYQNQIKSLLKGQGFVEVSTIIPFELDGRSMQKFLRQLCHLELFIYSEGYCYSDEWLEKCAMEFRQNIIYNIFFKKVEEGKKKGSKKKMQSNHITEEQLVETLYDAGLGEYTVLENLGGFLLPILNALLDELKIKCEKELAKNQGVINSGFLKYRTAKTILKSQDNLKRYLNTIQKQRKKGLKWQDPDFGPIQKDKEGKYSLIYYDGILYKNWPPINQLKWVPYNQELSSAKFNQIKKSDFMGKLLLPQLIQILMYHNQKYQQKIQTPFLTEYSSKQAPFVFRFYTAVKQQKYVLVDDLLPYVNESLFSADGVYSLVEKAYAKLRYCYKSILSVGFQQLSLQVTGKVVNKLQSDKQNIQKNTQSIMTALKSQKCVIVIGQGQANKRIIKNTVQTQFIAQKPYHLGLKDQLIGLYPNSNIQNNLLSIEVVQELFKNIYIF